MKTVMCYGDSLTWGYNPSDGTRYPFDQRWPGVLQQELGVGVRVIEEALNGRTAATDSWLLPDRNGRTLLAPLLESHAPLDLVILMLGTNAIAARPRARPGGRGRWWPGRAGTREESASGPRRRRSRDPARRPAAPGRSFRPHGPLLPRRRGGIETTRAGLRDRCQVVRLSLPRR